MPQLQAGDLDRRITIRRATVTTDAFNSPVEAWVDLVTVWASRKFVSDAEKARADQVGSSVTCRFQIRWSALVSDVDPRDQLLCEGRLYQVVAVKELNRREGLELSAVALGEAP